MARKEANKPKGHLSDDDQARADAILSTENLAWLEAAPFFDQYRDVFSISKTNADLVIWKPGKFQPRILRFVRPLTLIDDEFKEKIVDFIAEDADSSLDNYATQREETTRGLKEFGKHGTRLQREKPFEAPVMPQGQLLN